MTRDEMIEHMINLVESTPEGASMYHRMDMLLSRMERLGILPPKYPMVVNIRVGDIDPDSDEVMLIERFNMTNAWEPEND